MSAESGSPAKTSPNLIKFDEYRITAKIFESPRSLVLRAVRRVDDVPVILKILQEEYFNDEETERYKHEFEITNQVHSPFIINALKLKTRHNSPYIEFEDIGGEPLVKLIRHHTFETTELLEIATKIAEGIGDFHAQNIIHKDISSHNIVYNINTRALKIIDFAIASMLESEQIDLKNPQNLEGSLPYMSPEQTGRMNRKLDYRTDFYSLGIVLYELFTGKKPFRAEDPLKLIHFHIAKQPVPPNEEDPSIPKAISNIIMKLISKTAEERYQSSFGLKEDLKYCIEELRKNGDIRTFTLGRRDRPDKFTIPEKLYGREKEKKSLLQSFKNTLRGAKEIALISGYSGIGKSSLVNELHSALTESSGYFLTGRFSEFEKNVPYSGLISALGGLVRQILTEPSDVLEQWQTRLTGALKVNISDLTDTIPELGILLDTETITNNRTSTDFDQRFHLALKRFLSIICDQDRPVVLFLDDIQWMDAASTKLLTQIIGSKNIAGLFFIGAYRDNQISRGHFLFSALKSLTSQGVKVNEIKLSPLGMDDLTTMVADTLHHTKQEVRSLAQLLLEKTAGNPFFVEEFLKSLHQQNLLTFDVKTGKWEWSISKITSQQMTDNVIDLLSHKIKNLPENTQDLLRYAACIGPKFRASVILKVLKLATDKVLEAIKNAQNNGLIKPIESTSKLQDAKSLKVHDNEYDFQFTHDRIRNAAYNLNSASEKKRIHYAIGNILFEGFDKNANSSLIYEITNHLNYSMDLCKDEKERIELCNLNLLAARKAKSVNAAKTAFSFLSKSTSLLGPNAWTSHYPLTLNVHSLLCQCAFLIGKKETTEKTFQTITKNAKSFLDTLPAFEAKIHAEISENNMVEAAAIGRSLLRKLKCKVPKKPSSLSLGFSFLRTRQRLRGMTNDQLLAIKPMEEPRAIAKMRIQFAIAQCLYFTSPRSIILIICDAIRSSLKHGNYKGSPYFYACYGMLLCGISNDYEQGYRFGNLALDLVKKQNNKMYKSAVLLSYNVFIRHWKEHLKTTLDSLLESHNVGIETGEHEFATHAGMAYCYHSFLVGVDLEELVSQCQKFVEAIQSINQKGSIYLLSLFHQVTLNLLGLNTSPISLSGEAYNEMETLKRHERINDRQGIFANFFLRAQLCYLFGDYDQAVRCILTCKRYVDSVFSTAFVPSFYFYESLIYAAVYRASTSSQQKKLKTIISSNVKLLKGYAAHAPMNQSHRIALIEAECFRLNNDELSAQKRYDAAIIDAEKFGYTQELALSHELAARFYVEKERSFIATSYMKKAKYYYNRWGARSKVRHLEEKYPQLIFAKNGNKTPSTTVSTTSSSNIDIATLKKALLAIAEETVHSKMLEIIINNAIEFAGAQKGVLLLKKGMGEDYSVEAEGSIDLKHPKILQSTPYQESKNLCEPVINFVKRTKQSIVIGNACLHQNKIPGLHLNRYIVKNKVKSILCIPILNGFDKDSNLIGILYLENNRATNTFTEERIETLEIICLAAAGRIELSFQAATDGLTGLYNHQFFQNALDKEIVQSKRQARNLSLVMVDIDHFKSFNDKYGHQLGDQILRKVASTIQLVCRKSDLIARYGGEEICVILSETSPQNALIVAERIRNYIEKAKITVDNKELTVTASLGVAGLNKQIKSKELLIQEADRALYVSKGAGRNKVTLSNVA
ncbi:MAG: diguanylate cyclase [Oligoflexales bacterium]